MTQYKLAEVNVRLWERVDVSFAAHPDVNIIVGINGSGKTTLLSAIEKNIRGRIDEQGRCIYIGA